MGYELIITEKPNAAKKIADALADGKPIKSQNKKAPHYQITRGKQDIIVACAVGHLYGVREKDKGKWAYPIFNIEWAPAAEISKDAAYTTQYIQAIKKLAKDADSFTVATDYDIEGEVIGYNVLRFACKQKDGSRMKFSTLTQKDLINAYANKNKTLNWGQVNAGVTRHEMDWLYGINLSRALTLSVKHATGKFKLLSAGRVQGPALKIVVEKEEEIGKFKAEPYWQIEMRAEHEKKPFIAMHAEDKIWKKDHAEKIYQKIQGEKTAHVASVESKQFEQKPPTPFDLTSLQIEAHKTIRISPKRTLELAQQLYVGGYISYPRTSSQKLPKEIGYEEILEKLKKKFPQECAFLLKRELKPHEGSKTDDAHPAIYPTGQIPALKDTQVMNLYELIVRRFFAVFGDPAMRETMTIQLTAQDEPFVAKGVRTVKKGWHELYGRFVMFKEEELPKLTKGQDVAVNEINLLHKETQPPKRYTESSIIKELEKRGLGTKATRAQIVDNLFSRGYVHEKSLQATELGIRTCKILETYAPRILDEELTRHFETEMEEIRLDKKTHDQVIDEVQDVLIKLLDEFKKNEKDIGKELLKATEETRNELSYVGKCPKCETGELHIRKGRFGNFIACNKYPECETTFSLPAAGIKPLKKECEHCGLPMVLIIKKRKQPQEICINPTCPSKLPSDEKTKELKQVEKGEKTVICPKCKSKLVVRKSIYGAFLGCSAYPKCRYTEKAEPKEKEPTEVDLEKDLE